MMMKVLFAAAAAGAISSAALAQELNNNPATQDPKQSAQSPNTVNPAPPSGVTGSTYTPTTAAPTGQAADVVAISPDEARARGITVQVVASAPVPDTPENRAAFGQPMSRAGKMTAPRGN